MNRLISSAEAAAKCGVSVRTLARMIDDGRVPQPVRLSPRRIGWLESSFDAWLKEREEGACQK